MAVQSCEYPKKHWIVHFKCVIYTVCELKLIEAI